MVLLVFGFSFIWLSPVLASIESIKPVALDWTAQMDPFIDNDWNQIIEELYWTAEFV